MKIIQPSHIILKIQSAESEQCSTRGDCGSGLVTNHTVFILEIERLRMMPSSDKKGVTASDKIGLSINLGPCQTK